MRKILIVEDDNDLRETYIDIMENAGYSVVAVASNAQAFKMLTRQLPDLVILDMQLGAETGVLVLSFIRRYSPLASTKVVIVSGHPDLAKRASQDWQADLVLGKPISLPDLREKIQNICPVN